VTLGTAVRRLPRAVVAPLPVPVADAVRRLLAGGSGLRSRPLRRALEAAGIPGSVSTFTLVDDTDLRFLGVESQVLNELYWWGSTGWEPELVPWWRYFCRRSASVLELGANVGYFTVQGGRAAPSARYVAVEPHPFSAEVCRAHLALNGVTSVEVVQAAAVAEPGLSLVSLHVPADQRATPTVAFLGPHTELPTSMTRDPAVVDVPAVDVRELLDGVDLIKLDVEGQEHELLAAAHDYLRERRPTLVVEVLPGTQRLRAMLGSLCTADGYRCYAVPAGTAVPLSPERLETVQLMEEFGCQDVVLSVEPLPPLPPSA
jgi:FkbM family methyltransferase